MKGYKSLMVCFMVGVIGLFFTSEASAFWDKHGAELTFEMPDIEVTNLDLRIRNVPIHPADGYAKRSNAGPITRTDYTFRHTLYIAWRMEKNISALTRYGLKMKWIAYPHHNFSSTALRNYTNAVGTAQRGYGAALTFVGIEKRGIVPSIDGDVLDFFLNFTPEIFLEKSLYKEKFKKIVIGMSLSIYYLQAVNGWDRYDSLKVKDTYTLARVIPIGVYMRKGNIESGIKFPTFVKTYGLGDIKTRPAFYITIHW